MYVTVNHDFVWFFDSLSIFLMFLVLFFFLYIYKNIIYKTANFGANCILFVLHWDAFYTMHIMILKSVSKIYKSVLM